MLARYSIKDLYSLALAEGEGVGTAYEYYAKRLAFAGWLARRPRPQSILIAGLPERYGSSLDFMLLATELGAQATVIDDRPEALARLRDGLTRLRAKKSALHISEPAAWILGDLASLAAVRGEFDLALSSEVLQRLTVEGRAAYVRRLSRIAIAAALFAPNADNQAHTTISGLNGVSLAELRRLAHGVTTEPICDYIDMPPFPPGMTRTGAQRERAGRGRAEALAMWGLGGYARVEQHLPTAARRRRAHIVYALWPPG